jgi:site-specific recombinase XerD
MMEPEFFDYIRDMRLKVASTTYRRKCWQIRAYLRHLAAKGINYTAATQSDVETYLLSLRCSQQVRQSICCTVREFYSFHRISENPAADIEFKPDDSYHLPTVPSKAAVDEIIARLTHSGDVLHIRDLLMVELAYGSGLRRDELRKVNIEDVNLERQTIVVTGKGGKTRVLPLTTKAVQTIREYLTRRKVACGPLLVSYAGRRLSCNGVYSVMCNRVGIRTHLLRHACATHMLANGASIRVIQELLGHVDMNTTQIYTSIEKGNLSSIVNEKHPRKS